jgi:hypothetical protein
MSKVAASVSLILRRPLLNRSEIERICIDITPQMHPKEAMKDFELHVLLSGLTSSIRSSSFDLFCPQHRRASTMLPSKKLMVEPLDTISTWRNLSVAQADELFLWERVFQVALEDHLSGLLREKFLRTSALSRGYYCEGKISTVHN